MICLGLDSRTLKRTFVFSRTSRSAQELNKTLFNEYRRFSPGIKRPGRETDESPSSDVEVTNECEYITTNFSFNWFCPHNLCGQSVAFVFVIAGGTYSYRCNLRGDKLNKVCSLRRFLKYFWVHFLCSAGQWAPQAPC
jgi:hypothetical protein